MDVQDLMIGDWVYALVEGETIGEFVEKIPSKVTKIDDCDYSIELLRFPKTIDVEDCDMLECEPIPLTPEILEKNGAFKNPLSGEQRHFIYNLDGFELLAIYNSDFSFQINRGARKIKYVHELQHALKLCGIDKTIEL